MKNRCGKALWTIFLTALTMIAICQIAWAESGFIDMQDGATAVVGEPYTIKFVPGYKSSEATFSTIEVISPDKKLILSEDIDYKDMYAVLEVTFTPEQTGRYVVRGYSSYRYRHYESRYPVERYYMVTVKGTDTKEAVLLVQCKTHTYGQWTITKEADSKSEGEKKRTCSVCGHEETEVIPKTENNVSTSLKAPTSVKVKAKKNKVTVSWKAVTDKKLLKEIKSIEVQYSTDKKFKKNAKTKRNIAKTNTKVTLKLKKKKIYYIRVRFKGSSGYSAWSNVKKLKTKK